MITTWPRYLTQAGSKVAATCTASQYQKLHKYLGQAITLFPEFFPLLRKYKIQLPAHWQSFPFTTTNVLCLKDPAWITPREAHILRFSLFSWVSSPWVSCDSWSVKHSKRPSEKFHPFSDMRYFVFLISYFGRNA